MKRQADRKPRSAIRVILIIILVLALLALAVTAAYFITKRRGRDELHGEAGSIELPSPEASAPAASYEPYELPEGADVMVDGVAYRYRDELITLLFIGIDATAENAETEHFFEADHADSLYLAVIDEENARVDTIAISRNTMAQIEQYGAYGDYIGEKTAQIGMAYAYGDTPERCCELVQKAVSKLFYGLPISGYYAVYMDAIKAANDAMGGVPVKFAGDLTELDPAFENGAEVTLTGEQAMRLVRNRDTDVTGSNETRVAHQTMYLKAFALRAKSLFASNPLLPVELYNTISGYSVTDISMSSALYLAETALRSDIRTGAAVEGSTKDGRNYDEFYADDGKLYDMILEMFYEKLDTEK